ncbi:MAG: hypothetical protein LBS74_09925 [Oscillospiraceae bacterium]|jgi:hypothetical protein|nr:hypothetical protein [Oscillospiraceae bacterium]
MSLIPCNSECTHQQEGYCMLEKPDTVRSRNISDGCPHYIDKGQGGSLDTAPKC